MPLSGALDRPVISTSLSVPLKLKQFKNGFPLRLLTEKHIKVLIAHAQIRQNRSYMTRSAFKIYRSEKEEQEIS